MCFDTAVLKPHLSISHLPLLEEETPDFFFFHGKYIYTPFILFGKACSVSF